VTCQRRFCCCITWIMNEEMFQLKHFHLEPSMSRNNATCLWAVWCITLWIFFLLQNVHCIIALWFCANVVPACQLIWNMFSRQMWNEHDQCFSSPQQDSRWFVQQQGRAFTAWRGSSSDEGLSALNWFMCARCRVLETVVNGMAETIKESPCAPLEETLLFRFDYMHASRVT